MVGYPRTHIITSRKIDIFKRNEISFSAGYCFKKPNTIVQEALEVGYYAKYQESESANKNHILPMPNMRKRSLGRSK